MNLKTLATIGAAAICSVAMAAEDSTVTSANVVGYNTQSVTKGNFNALGLNFVSTDGKGFNPDTMLTGEGVYGSTLPATSDQIWIWNPLTSGYEKWYFYYGGEGDAYNGWWDVLTQTKTFPSVHPNGLPAGTAVWYVSVASAPGGNAVFSGQVDAAASTTLTLNQGNFNLFANPYPDGLRLDDKTQVDWSNAGGNTLPASSDQIWIWNAITSGYEKWYYYYGGEGDAYNGWWDVLTQTKTFPSVHPNGLPSGTPVWYVATGTLGAANTFDVTFKSPIK